MRLRLELFRGGARVASGSGSGFDSADVVAGSGSSGAGGGVVSIVHPIHPEITSTSRTKSRTGIPTAHSCHSGGSNPT